MKTIILKKRILIFVIIAMVTSMVSLKGFDQSRFFHAQYFPQEPRFEEENLTSCSFRFFTGKTNKATDCCGSTLFTKGNNINCSNGYLIQSIIVDFYHNIYNGFYMGATVPWYRFKINEDNYETILSSSANIYLMGGFTHNYEQCVELDFIDFTLETGLVLPAGDHQLRAQGIPFRGACAVGIFDWITTGISADIIAFFDDNNGRLWDLTWYLKADHIVFGFSCLLGYTHSNQHKTPVPWSGASVPFWTMDTLHFEASFDSACAEHPYLPSLYFFYNHVLSGKNVIRTPQTGLGISLDF